MDGVTFVHKKNDAMEIKNYRPIALITIICKLWEIMTKRITPDMRMVTTEKQIAYKQRRSTIVIISLVRNSIPHDKT